LSAPLKSRSLKAVRRAVNLQRLVVDVLVADWEVDAEQFGVAASAHQVDIQERLGQAAAPAHLNPAQVRVATEHSAPGQEVPRAVVEVLQVHVAHDRAGADDQFDDAGLQTVFGAQEVVDHRHLGALFGDDQRVVVAADAAAAWFRITCKGSVTRALAGT
jgi:hypothetical protein